MNISCLSVEQECGQFCIPKDLYCCSDGSYCTSGSICCDGGLSAGQIAAIVGGSVSGLMLFVGLGVSFFYWIGKKKLHKELEMTTSLETVETESPSDKANESSIYIGDVK
jgi:hypothetical protein